jgi:hypothetical protein
MGGWVHGTSGARGTLMMVPGYLDQSQCQRERRYSQHFTFRNRARQGQVDMLVCKRRLYAIRSKKPPQERLLFRLHR